MTKETITSTSSSAQDTGSPGQGPLVVARVRPAYQQVADQLLDLILSGTLSAGDRLPSEAELSSVFGVSRSTVREALRVLTSRDLVETARGTAGGTFVRRVEIGQVSEYLQTSLGLMSGTDSISLANLLEAREILEVPAARLAAERREEHHLDALREAIEREKRTRERGLKFEEHRTFHYLIAHSAANGLLELMTEPVFRVLQTRFLDHNVTPRFWDSVDHDHETILQAIADQDPLAAADAMHEHLVKVRDTYHDRD